MITPPAHLDDALIVCAFQVEVRPQPKERARVVKGHAFTPRATTVFEARLATEARKAMKGRPPTTEDCLRAFLIFRQADKRRSDADNIVKAALDALEGICYGNDSQITEIRAQLHRGASENQCAVLIAGPDPRSRP